MNLTMKTALLVLSVAGLALPGVGSAQTQDLDVEIAQLRASLADAKSDYEARIAALEQRLQRAEQLAGSASRDADQAIDIAEQAAIDATSSSSAANTYNPALGAVLVGRFGDVERSWDSIPGFISGGEIGPGGSGFSLGESEINLNANIDPRFFGNLTLAVEDDAGETEIGLEEAWIQTTTLPHGIAAKAGRYFSNVAYLNGFHRHSDEFADRPLPYQAFLGGQYIADGLQMTWLAPTALFLEFGAEMNWGSGFPMSGNGESGPDAWTLSGKVGGDIGDSQSWQAGLSYLRVDVLERNAGDDAVPGEDFSGDSNLAIADFVWKWAPAGNSTVNNFKIQGEYFHRDEKGSFASLPYDGMQSGWYLQSIWQFRQGWRVGARYDEVSSDNGTLFAGTILQDPSWTPRRASVMLDWSPSEFSRLRMQYTDDRVQDAGGSQFLLQYLMSLGAHGAHRF